MTQYIRNVSHDAKGSIEPISPVGGALRVGVDDSPAPPLCFGPPGTSEFRGFEVDLLVAIADKLGLALHCESAGWDDALTQLQASRLDILCRAVAITAARRRLVDFSDPYLETDLSLVVRRDSKIHGPGDLIGLLVGVRRATTAEEFVRTHCPAAILRTFDSHGEPHRALGDRAVDAVVVHTPIANYFARTEPGLRVSGGLEGTALRCGLVLAPGNDTLRHGINRVLAELRVDGTSELWHRRWFAEGATG